MNEIFITTLKYKDHNFNIYITNGKIDVRSINDYVSQNIINEVKKIFFDRNKIKSEKYFKITKKNVLNALITQTICVGILLGTYKHEEIDKIKTPDISTELLTNLDINVDTIDESYDLELYSNFVNTIYSNPYLSSADKKQFLKRFDYINENKDFINHDELFKTLRSVRIVRHTESKPNVLGDFVLDSFGKPVINLYAGSTHETLIHEQYHAIKYNTYYWDKVYYYENRFIGNDEYQNLSEEEKLKCGKKEILGNMIEEAHTSILTAKEDNTINMNYCYEQEVYLYKMYEKIFGYKKMEQIMLSSNQAAGFLNAFLEVGCTKEEAIAFVERLDSFNTLLSETKVDLSNIRYLICDDLTYVYEKKFKHTDDPLLLATIDSISSNINTENLSLLEKNCNNKNLFNDMINGNLQILNYIDENLVFNEYMNYGINSLDIDYFSENTPVIYIKTDSFYTLKFKIDKENNLLVLNDVTHDIENFQLCQSMYEDYMVYANNNYNDSNYCKYFSILYANSNIEVEEKMEFLEYYDCFSQEDFEDEKLMNFLLSNKSPKIRKYLLSKQNNLVQNR